jgi:glycoside/pentoside/hexuronide:cation symporter, GPH family
VTAEAPLARRLLALYALPAFVLALPTVPAYVYLPKFYAETLGLGLTATGAALLIARLFDVVTDPAVGIASDRLRFRIGRRKPWIAVGAVLAGSALVALFQPPEAVSVGYLIGWAMLLYFGWTLVAVPYAAWGAELSRDYHGRTRITAAREAAQIFGILVGSAMPALLIERGGGEVEALGFVAWLAVIVGLPTIAALLLRVPEVAASAPAGAVASGWRRYGEILRNRPFLRLLGAWLINGLANGIPSVLFLLYMAYVLRAGAATQGLLIFTYFLAGVAAVPLWLRLSRRFGKHRTWCFAMIGACAAFVWVPLLGPGDVAAFFVICLVTGMALGADLALPPAIQADVIDLDELRSGEQRAGLFFALWSMGTKLAMAAAVGIAFPAIEALGFRIGEVNEPSALFALAVIYAGLPTVLKLIAILLMWRHPLTERRHGLIQKRLAQRAYRDPSRRQAARATQSAEPQAAPRSSGQHGETR